jgi:hypothetical protein
MAFISDQSDCARPPAKFNQELVVHIKMHNLLRSGAIVRSTPCDEYVVGNQTIDEDQQIKASPTNLAYVPDKLLQAHATSAQVVAHGPPTLIERVMMGIGSTPTT